VSDSPKSVISFKGADNMDSKHPISGVPVSDKLVCNQLSVYVFHGIAFSGIFARNVAIFLRP
jgi:hypothetical protein